MIYLFAFLIVALSAFLWRVRGGLRFYGCKAPLNKIWYSVAFAFYGCLFFGWSIENWLIGFIACYASYQLYGWGLYIGSLLTRVYALNPEVDKECELIDDILYPLHITLKGNKYYLYQYPKLFGFLGTTLTGLIITFLWGLFLGSIPVMLSGLCMGVCYWIGGKINNEGKNGWNWGEWIFGTYLGAILALVLTW